MSYDCSTYGHQWRWDHRHAIWYCLICGVRKGRSLWRRVAGALAGVFLIGACLAPMAAADSGVITRITCVTRDLFDKRHCTLWLGNGRALRLVYGDDCNVRPGTRVALRYQTYCWLFRCSESLVEWDILP